MEEKNELDKAEKMQQMRREFVRDAVIFMLVFLFNFFIVRNYIAEGVTVDGASMQNTLYNNERLLIEKVSMKFDDLNRFDIIIFDPQNDVDKYWIKRVIGLPGETVQIVGEKILINGEVLDENYGKDPIIEAGWFAEPYTLAEDEYFVMGDNRQNSTDSRVIGPIHRDVIEGKAVFRFWPINRLGGMK